MKKRMFMLALLAITSLGFTGCSVIMSGTKKSNPPQVSNIKSGVSKNMVENQLGQPKNWETNKDGTYTGYYVYKFSPGAKGRMAMHAILDLFTLGFWEPIGTIWELAEGGEKYTFTVTYDSNMQVIDIK